MNDDQVGPILRFAVANADVINGIAYQPVAFTGRIARHELEAKRYTLGDLAAAIAKETGADVHEDFFPASLVTPMSRFLQVLEGKPKIRLSCHADCGIGTYFFITPEGDTVPIPRMFDLVRLFAGLDDLAAEVEARDQGARATRLDLARAAWLFLRSYRWRNMRRSITPWGFVKALRAMTDKGYGRGEGATKAYRTLMTGGMHFMDRYNYDTERVRRCVIQYSTPDGLYPFCTINSGPVYRPFIEALHARPLAVKGDGERASEQPRPCRATRDPPFRSLGARSALLLAGAGGGWAAEPTPDGRAAAPVTAEHRYRLSAAIRPLLFWIGRSNVGGARITWRADGDGRKGYELLLGSDPARAPRKINRWGWAREDVDASGATMLGLMNRSEDDSLDQAKSSLVPGQAGYLFKLNRARVERGVARAEATTIHAPEDFTFRQLGELLRFADESKPTPRVRRAGCPRGRTRGCSSPSPTSSAPGSRRPVLRQPRAHARRTVQYTFNAGVYDLTVSSWERVERARFGARTYEKLVRLEFESRNREKGNTERFVFACGTRGGPRRGPGLRPLSAEVVVQGRGCPRRG